MSIEQYFNNLHSDTEFIFYFDKKAVYIPSIIRFTKLKILVISFNNLTYISNLTNTIIDLDIQHNNISDLPTNLPIFLQTFNCQKNKIKILPKLPLTLCELNCAENLLVQLPELPNNLKKLICFSNELISLPSLPKLEFLSCYNNKLTNIPYIPDSLLFLNADNNEISCQHSFIKSEFWKVKKIKN